MRLICVEWNDACSSHHWEPIEDPTHVLPCITVGTLLREDENEVEVALTISPHHSKNNNVAIPKGCIKRIRTLRVKLKGELKKVEEKQT